MVVVIVVDDESETICFEVLFLFIVDVGASGIKRAASGDDFRV